MCFIYVNTFVMLKVMFFLTRIIKQLRVALKFNFDKIKNQQKIKIFSSNITLIARRKWSKMK